MTDWLRTEEGWIWIRLHFRQIIIIRGRNYRKYRNKKDDGRFCCLLLVRSVVWPSNFHIFPLSLIYSRPTTWQWNKIVISYGNSAYCANIIFCQPISSLCESHKSRAGRHPPTTNAHIGRVLNHNSMIIKLPGANNKGAGEDSLWLDSVINFIFAGQM